MTCRRYPQTKIVAYPQVTKRIWIINLHIFQRTLWIGCLNHYLFHFQALLTYHFNASETVLERTIYAFKHTLFQDTCMYILKSVGLVTKFVHSSHRVNAPCYDLETILNIHSRSYYLHTLEAFQNMA